MRIRKLDSSFASCLSHLSLLSSSVCRRRLIGQEKLEQQVSTAVLDQTTMTIKQYLKQQQQQQQKQVSSLDGINLALKVGFSIQANLSHILQPIIKIDTFECKSSE